MRAPNLSGAQKVEGVPGAVKWVQKKINKQSGRQEVARGRPLMVAGGAAGLTDSNGGVPRSGAVPRAEIYHL